MLVAIAGKEAATGADIARGLKPHGCAPKKKIEEVCIDLWPTFIAGVRAHSTDTKQTVDKFHLIKLMGETVDEVSQTELEERPEELYHTPYLWLKSPDNLKLLWI